MTTLPQTQEPAPSSGFSHVTVLQAEVVQAVEQALSRQQGLPGSAPSMPWVVDCTLGGGGHSQALLSAMPQIGVLGLDRDPAALAAAQQRLAPFGNRFVCEHAQFSQLAAICQRRGLPPLLAVVADLGVSSHQFDTAQRGFSLRLDGPLDMRMDPTRGPTALELLERVRLEDLADVLYQYGDIQRSIGTARIVLEEVAKGAHTTARLAERLAARLGRSRSIHPATQVFQALRMWVNGEDAEVDALLRDAPGLLAQGGALAIISFHSGEDRPVKRAMAELGKKGGAFWLPHRKPVGPSPAEEAANPRARSAHLRVLVAGKVDRYRAADSWHDTEDEE